MASKRMMAGALAAIMGAGFGQVAPNPVCTEAELNRIKGPSPYGPRTVAPPDHDLPADPKPMPVHKGVNLEVWHKSGDNFQVGGLALLANGDMLELDYSGRLYHVTGLDSAHKVTRRVLPTTSFPDPLGLYLRNNREVYVLTAHALFSFDFDGTSLTQQKEILAVPKKAGWYTWNSDLEFDGSFLYAALNTRGSVGRYHVATATWELDFATSLRNSHGMGMDDSGRIWASDNQGNYRPASPIFLLKRGKSYGVPNANGTTGAGQWQNTLGPDPVLDAYRSDMIWLPYNGMSQSATDIHFLKSGPFKGQALVGDNRTGHLNRLILEKVDGQMQGAALRMTGGLEAGTYRIAEGPNGRLYLGGLGTGGSYWNWCHKHTGFQRLTFKADFLGNPGYNDVLKVSLVAGGLVIAFTSDISADFLDPANFRAYTFNYIKSVSPYYGGPKSDSASAGIREIAKRSNREIQLTIDGLSKESILALEFGGTLTAGNNLQASELFYTLNRLSTQVPTDLPTAEAPGRQPVIRLLVSGGRLHARGIKSEAVNPLVIDPAGNTYAHLDYSGFPAGGSIDISPLRPGVYFLRMTVGGRALSKAFLIR